MTKPSCKGIFAASDLATRGKDNGISTRTYHNKIRPRSICDDNFLSERDANFLSFSSDGSTCFSSSSYVHFKVNLLR